MNKEHGIVICPGVTVSDNYIRLTNKPKINGIELCGNKTSTQLNLLSNQIGEYSEIDLATAGNDSYMLVFPQAGQPSKVRVGNVFHNGSSNRRNSRNDGSRRIYIQKIGGLKNGTND